MICIQFEGVLPKYRFQLPIAKSSLTEYKISRRIFRRKLLKGVQNVTNEVLVFILTQSDTDIPRAGEFQNGIHSMTEDRCT